MAYRRKQGITRASTFKEEIHHRSDNFLSASPLSTSSSFSNSSSIATQAVRESSAHRESSLSSVSGHSDPLRSKLVGYEDISSQNTSKSGFWGVLARKAKAILDDDDGSHQFAVPERTRSKSFDITNGQQSYQSYERKLDNTNLRKGLNTITSPLNAKAYEEGRIINTEDDTQESRGSELQNPVRGEHNSLQQPMQTIQCQIQNTHETRLEASRDIAMATAAKAKLLLRELKTAKADLNFSKERCAQLEEENKILRENRQKGDNPADDDLIRLQLETLLEEKAGLAHENSIYARENRFLREIVEYHQLTMQDVVYLDEGIEDVTEGYPLSAVSRMLSISPPLPPSPRRSFSGIPQSEKPPMMKEILSVPSKQIDCLRTEVSPSSSTSDNEDLKT